MSSTADIKNYLDSLDSARGIRTKRFGTLCVSGEQVLSDEEYDARDVSPMICGRKKWTAQGDGYYVDITWKHLAMELGDMRLFDEFR